MSRARERERESWEERWTYLHEGDSEEHVLDRGYCQSPIRVEVDVRVDMINKIILIHVITKTKVQNAKRQNHG